MSHINSPQKNLRQIVLDTETTGLSPSEGHRIIEVAALEIINRHFTGNYLHFYLNPERAIDAGAKKVHGLSEKFLADKPKFQEIAHELFDYIKDSELIIHNAPFDLGFLDHEFKKLNKDFQPINQACTIIDTLVMARDKHRGQKNNLDALCNRYSISLASREKHGALIDTQLLGEVYLAMTGGQMTLFDTALPEENTTAVQAQQKETFARRLASQTFKVLYATTEEIGAHEEYMEKL